MLLAVARHDAVAKVLASHGSVEEFAGWLESEAGQQRVNELVERFQSSDADAAEISEGDSFAPFVLDGLMDLDVLARLRTLEAKVYGDLDD